MDDILLQKFSHGFGGLDPRVRKWADANAFGDIDRGVAELVWHYLQGNIHGEHQRSARVAKFVNRPVAEPSLLGNSGNTPPKLPGSNGSPLVDVKKSPSSLRHVSPRSRASSSWSRRWPSSRSVLYSYLDLMTRSRLLATKPQTTTNGLDREDRTNSWGSLQPRTTAIVAIDDPSNTARSHFTIPMSTHPVRPRARRRRRPGRAERGGSN